MPDERYLQLPAEQVSSRIARRRRELGEALLILAHHYQRDEIVQHADFVGDSLRLSVRAAEAAQHLNVKWIIFCGVHFMAETADLLTGEHIAVILPNLRARCPMAEMAREDDVRAAIDLLVSDRAQPDIAPLVPIAYVNSSAAVKAIVGERGGACCTSANAERLMRWALNGGQKQGQPARVLFLPDEHLGRNVCAALGIPEAQQMLWDPTMEHAGPARPHVAQARVILWKGHCYVHTRFTQRDVAHARQSAACDGVDLRIVVHPECTREVVAGSDDVTSTEGMVNMIEAGRGACSHPPFGAQAGRRRWVVGTESHLVQRLAKRSAERGLDVRLLGRSLALCGAMLHIAPPDLLWVLDNLAAPRQRIVNRVRVAAPLREPARCALQRMLTAAAPASSAGAASAE
jgi:quinolinate synthase